MTGSYPNEDHELVKGPAEWPRRVAGFGVASRRPLLVMPAVELFGPAPAIKYAKLRMAVAFWDIYRRLPDVGRGIRPLHAEYA